jgi:hypothetical protein
LGQYDIPKKKPDKEINGTNRDLKWTPSNAVNLSLRKE